MRHETFQNLFERMYSKQNTSKEILSVPCGDDQSKDQIV